MYKDKFILAVKHNNKILRENKNIVHLPFDSEFSLLLKNENNRRALVSIKIDSKDVLFGSNIVLDSNSETTIERFLENNDSGKKFKFVKLENEKVLDKDNPENGLVEVDFWLEEQIKIDYSRLKQKRSPYDDDRYNPWITPNNPFYDYDKFRPKTGDIIYCSNTQDISNLNIKVQSFNYQSDIGATVEGSKSDQKFNNIFTRGKDLSTHVQIRLWLRAIEIPVYVEDTKNKFCTQCGKKLQYKDKFCSQCGNNVENIL